MILQELLISALSIATLAGGTACIMLREKNWNKPNGKDDKHSSRNVKFIPQNHAA